ncbi:formate-dependent nitrite reductase, membrane component NrfD [Thermodesulfovibrio aggregans]|uniref:Formate-dependent nitrite reductase, membrane component NrfD n=1 Tax=Thermodesulfovibrio aggregans TaxID=86166 RepID=A0A0U9HVU6_9BACT|nr:NrfD/PsrC family molybdoenzyme membrane anchor subunit [Thermodesulfovibrio aggregans]GAQ95025.1 formate-dependent nitrite reductase, membrane component NrfD [Thermodesulfovibrio aggregans]
MIEIGITGTNTITFPYLEVWDWRIVLYLFLGGLSAGMLVMCSIANLRIPKQPVEELAQCVRAPLIAFIVLAVGALFIIFDLGSPFNLIWGYLTFQPLSLMSWGTWGVPIVLFANALYILAVIPKDQRHRLKFSFLIKISEKLALKMRPIAKLNFALGIFLGIYTGVLLSSFSAIPLWNNATLPILFLISALSSGAAMIVIIAKKAEIKFLFTKIDIWLIVAELVVIALFFYGLYTSTAPYKKAIEPFFSLTSEHFIFTVALIAIFLLLPLALRIKLGELKEFQNEVHEEFTKAQIFRMNFAAVLVIAGTLILRAAIVYAGQLTKLSPY